MKLKVLDLFSGIGGFSLGLERTGGFETEAFCEIEPFCQDILRKHWPDKLILNDIMDIQRSDINGEIDVICGGFPCQPFSLAGELKGKKDNRDLWPEMFRVIKTFSPTWVIGENVANFTNMAFTRTKVDLESVGYVVQPFVIPACAVGARHRRDRVWVVAYSNDSHGKRRRVPRGVQEKLAELNSGSKCRETSEPLAHTKQQRLPGQRESLKPSDSKKVKNRKATKLIDGGFQEFWRSEPRVGRVANGIPKRVDRLKALGNAVVPQIPQIIGTAILKWEKENEEQGTN